MFSFQVLTSLHLKCCSFSTQWSYALFFRTKLSIYILICSCSCFLILIFQFYMYSSSSHFYYLYTLTLTSPLCTSTSINVLSTEQYMLSVFICYLVLTLNFCFILPVVTPLCPVPMDYVVWTLYAFYKFKSCKAILPHSLNMQTWYLQEFNTVLQGD